MAVHITAHRGGFGPGLTEVTRLDDDEGTGLALSVLVLAPGERRGLRLASETAILMMSGAVDVWARDADLAPGGEPLAATWARRSLFDEGPSCLHAAAGAEIDLVARVASEVTLYATANVARFPGRLYAPADVHDEARGRGLVRDGALRYVRTIFDRTKAPAAAELVLGEVVTLPGRWSSYPPHHHPQPELYHYRFTRPEGYGHAELGESVSKVRSNDTIKILAGHDHAQCAAPGYGMYYSWVIRHLPGQPYEAPTFTAEHAWTLTAPASETWWPKGLGGGDGA